MITDLRREYPALSLSQLVEIRTGNQWSYLVVKETVAIHSLLYGQ